MLRRLVVGTALVCGVAAWLAPAAFPWYSLISAKMSCDGTVDWTASAWSGPTPASRYNPDVLVSVSYDHGVTFKRVAERAFDKADNYQFAGLYPAGDASSVFFRVQELANWPAAGGDVPGPPHYALATRPASCAAPKSAVKGVHHTVAKKTTPVKAAPKAAPKPAPKTSRPHARHEPKQPVRHKKPVPAHPATLPFTR